MYSRILLINRAFESTRVSSNKGMEAILLATLNQLRSIFPNVKFTTFMHLELNFARQYDIEYIQMAKPSSRNFTFCSLLIQTLDLIRCILWAGIWKIWKKNWKSLLNSKRLKHVIKSDIIIQLIADNYSDMFLPWIIHHSLDLLICKCIKKPLIFYGATVQIKSGLGKRITKFVLNRADIIVLRERHSEIVLQSIGVTTSQYITFDPAFYFKQNGAKADIKSLGVTGEHPVFGMCIGDKHPLLDNAHDGTIPVMYSIALYLRYFLPSKVFQFILRIIMASPLGHNVRKGTNEHLITTVKLIDCIVAEFNCDILLIPHHSEDNYPINSDNLFYEQILQSLNNKLRVYMVRGEFSAEETKQIIGCSDIFIGGKLHSCINSLSQCVPTVALSYSFKFFEIMKMMRQENLVVQEFGVEETLNKIRYAWVNREGIRQELEMAMKEVEKQAITNEKILSGILLKYYNRVA